MSTTRKNHYVPIWYQKRFLLPGQGAFLHLDLYPETKKLSDGRIVTLKDVYCWGPKQCFVEQDLYTTKIFGEPNDEIEKYLFGGIDRKGSIAIRALVSNDLEKLYHYYIYIFEYLDAQKLRTPKGLNWIKSHYNSLSQLELMVEMQQLRRMHCTMWAEAAREIVSAENSSVKFIVSDHPVTIYNYACPPDSPQCRYPDDPAVAMKASQTIFPLDLNHCLILTNLEYARDPHNVDPLSNRTHARHFGQTLVKYDDMIRTRVLREEEASAINLVLKARAHRYIGAAKKEWLYPETEISSAWSEVGKVLLPPANELYQFGGEIYVGGADGKLLHYQDEFGRSLGEIAHLKKEPKKNIGRNDPCSCGSGKKYKKCCLYKPASKRPSATEYSIRERNGILFRAVTDILALDSGKTWEDVRRDISDDQVRKIHEMVGSLWPRETNLTNLLPHPDSSTLRALYAGIVDPRVILRNVVGLSLYFDEIIVLSPFTNPACVKDEYNPILSPSQYKQETIKNVMLLLQLAPFIKAGTINMIPDPCDFDNLLRKKAWAMAKERTKESNLGIEADETVTLLMREDFELSLFNLPEESQKQRIKEVTPEITDETLAEVLEYIEAIKMQSPLTLLQPLSPGKKGAQLVKTLFVPNLELSLFLAQATGSFIYTASPYKWSELLRAMNDGRGTSGGVGWDTFVKSLASLDLSFIDKVDPSEVLSFRQSGKLGEFRKLLRNIWKNVLSNPESDKVDVLAQRFAIELKEAYLKIQAEWQTIQNDIQEYNKNSLGPPMATVNGKINCEIPPSGFGINTVNRLLLSHSGRTDYLKRMPMCLFIKFD